MGIQSCYKYQYCRLSEKVQCDLSVVKSAEIWSQFSDSILRGHFEEECSTLSIGVHAVNDLQQKRPNLGKLQHVLGLFFVSFQIQQFHDY